MKKIYHYFFIAALVILSFTTVWSQSNSFSTDFGPMWERARDYTLEVAEAMPEENYDFKAAEDVMTFKEQLLHISGNLYYLSSVFVEEKESIVSEEMINADSKKETIEKLIAAFDYVGKLVNGISDKEINQKITLFTGEEYKKERVFYLMKDHTAHHRAQCITYLRMNEITPPKYRGW